MRITLRSLKKMTNFTNCFLKQIETEEKILLPDQKTVILGRNPTTKIKDINLSKHQIECKANYEKGVVEAKVVGRTLSGLNGFGLRQGNSYQFSHEDCIELKLGTHKFEVNFKPTPRQNDSTEEPKAKKPKMAFPLFNTQGKVEKHGNWEILHDKALVVFTGDKCGGREKIAGFDIDGTIIKTKSGAVFPKNPQDWIFFHGDVPKKLRDLYEKDFKIVFFTNQMGMTKSSEKLTGFKSKIETIIGKIGIPIQVFIASDRGMFRKPVTGMWETLKTSKNDSIKINLTDSFYVGDAAGRPKNWIPKKPKDHSLVDRLFALNIGLRFYTPEEYFFKAPPAAYDMPEFDPRVPTNTNYPNLFYKTQNVILMCGGPGSGKSSFCKSKLVPEGYEYINRDTLGTWQKCVKKLEESLESGRNAVIDNTNPDKKTREKYVETARKFGVDIRCFLMETSINQSKHNNKFREITDKSHVAISDMIIHGYYKNFESPELEEGFCEIVKIPFVVNFHDNTHEELYKMFLLEK